MRYKLSIIIICILMVLVVICSSLLVHTILKDISSSSGENIVRVSEEYIPPTPEPTPIPTPEPTPSPTPTPIPTPEPTPEPWSYDESLSYEQNIYDYLIEEAGLSKAAVCGIMSNISCETGDTFDPNSTNPYSHSYGICQWLGVRKTNLQDWCYENDKDYTSLTGQLDFLIWELKYHDPYGTWDELQSVEDSAEGAYHAGWYFCYWFERPSNLKSQSTYRGSIARDYYINSSWS